MPAANIVDVPLVAGLPGRYVPEERLGHGASGETFAVVDTTDGAACVAKVFAGGAAARGAAVNELAGLQALAHPSVVRVRDIGRLEDGRLFLVTERLAGASVASIASCVDDAARRAALQRAAQELAGALAHLHGRGLVHGDVCPANVRLAADGRAVLIDFGLAGPPLPGDGAARGTLGYAAPEALTGVRIRRRRSVRAGRDAVRSVERRAAVRARARRRAAHADRAGAGAVVDPPRAGRRVGPRSSRGCSPPIRASGRRARVRCCAR